MMSALKTNLQFSIEFHPQTDGIAEVSNRTLGQLLSIHYGDGRWVKTLPLLALLYNPTPQSCTGQFPYFVATGRQPALLVDLALRDLKVPAVSQFLQDISRLWETMKTRAELQAKRDKQAADRARRASNIVGNLVLLSTHYLLLRSSPRKFKPHFVRPFRVTKAVGANALELELPTSMKVTHYSTFLSCINSKANINRQDLLLLIKKLITRWRRLLDIEGMANITNT